MTFYGERFHRKDEEDIWEQLKQMLLNPASDEEIALNKQQEQAKIDLALEKMFPSVTKPQADPYLNYEDLLPEKKIQNEKIKCLTEPTENILTNISNPLEELKDTFALDNSDTIAGQIKDKLSNTFSKDNLKKVAGAGLQAASLIPQVRGAGILAKGAGAVGKKLAPKAGRKIAKEIGDGTVAGTVSGALEGLGRGLITDENPLKTTLQDAGIGAVLGTTGGAVGGKIEKAARGNKLKRYGNIDLLDKTSRKQYSKDAKDYYQDYVQGKLVNKDGPINMTNRGHREILRWNPKQAQNFPELTKDIKNAKKQPNMPNNDNEKLYTDHFEVYRGKQGDHLIEVNKNGNRRYYTTKDIPEGSLRAPSTGTLENSSIIPSFQPNLNPSQQATQKLGSFNDWLEELKRKRKKRNW